MISSTNPQKLQLILKTALHAPIILDFSPRSLFAKFCCLSSCHECCGYSYFLRSELSTLPSQIKEQLVLKDDRLEIKLKENRCVFYGSNAKQNYFCSIYHKRPLRCRIYPFFPLIVDQRIIITLEPALRMLNHKKQEHNCPGIGNDSKPLKTSINECISFLRNLQDSPMLLASMILDSDKFNKIRNDRWFLEHSNL